MKYLKRFIESVSDVREFDEHTDSDIRQLFTDYTDENSDSLSIENVFISNGSIVPETKYIKKGSKYRRAKLIKLRLGKLDGIQLPGMEKCSTSIQKLIDVLSEIERFYDLSEEKDVNFNISMDWQGLIVSFVILGGFVKEEESLSDKIDDYLKRIKEALNTMGHKRVTLKGNWLDARFAKKNDYSFGISQTLRKINNGEMTLDNTDRDYYRKMIEVRNEAREDGLKFDISGGDQQVVLKLVKI